ncbi:MAG: putative LPS assembly protein LptD [Flavobacteriaceae bacterium]|nr:putative LPS assembly protein LptD [Flavobacteriaceae bacterium]
MLFSWMAHAQEFPIPTKEPQNIPAEKDTLSVRSDSIQMPKPEVLQGVILDTVRVDTTEVDSIRKDTVKKNQILDANITYKAKDYRRLDQKKKRVFLYNEAEVYYTDVELKAGQIVIDYEKNLVYAGRLKDTAGNYVQYPFFKQGTNAVEPDSIIYNYKSGKALIFNSRTKQGEINIISPISKRVNDSVIYIRNAKLTTSTDLDDPEYYFLARRLKVVPGQKAVVGVTNMYIADIPTPIGIPFGFFPLSSKKSVSGVIVPTFGDDARRGFFLQNGGYYFALSDYYDLAIVGDFFTNGSWALRFESQYAARYKYRGNISFRNENLITSERGLSDFSKSTNRNFRWSHTRDPKSSPNSSFSASVNIASSDFFRESINQLNTSNFLSNTLSSSISYSRTFPGPPSINMSMTVTHSQNTNTDVVNMTLPTFQGSVERIFPFAPRVGVKRGALQNINFQYNLRAENRIQTFDSLFLRKEMFDDAKVAAQHTIPIATNFKVFKYFSVSMGTNYNEVWTLNTIDKKFDTLTNRVETIEVDGFDTYRTYDFSTSVGTTIYGTFNFGEDKRIQAIRHVMRPSVSYSYRPAFDQFFEEFELPETDTSGNPLPLINNEFTRFEGGIFGAPSNQASSFMGFSLANTFEAKVRDRDTTKTEPKKITLLSSLNFSTGYNFEADSLKLSPLSVRGGTQLFNNTLGVNFGMVLDPYALDNNNNKFNTLNINNGGSLFRLTSANITMDYAFSSKDFKPRENRVQDGSQNNSRDDDLFGVSDDFSDNRLREEEDGEEEEKETKLYMANMPWDLRLAHSFSYNNARRQNEVTNNSLMVSGNIDLTPGWRIGASTGYDFINNGFTFTQLRFERDLRTWRINFNWTPLGARQSWFFFIGIKSSVLSEIKYEKNRPRDQRL